MAGREDDVQRDGAQNSAQNDSTQNDSTQNDSAQNIGAQKHGTQTLGSRTPDVLAKALLAQIRGRELPPGSHLDPLRLAAVLAATHADVAAALERLEDLGATVRVGDSWLVRTDRQVAAREILKRGQPLLVATARLAATQATPGQAAAISAARDRFVGLAGDGTLPTRAAGYRDMLMQMAGASGSRFHLDCMQQILAEAADLIDPIVQRDMALFPVPDPDEELARLCRAIMRQDPESAAQAMEDHLIMIGCHMNALAV
jgi:DNA-binding GntR family transcriptional regulator